MLTVISKDSWHYRLTRYGFGGLANRVKRACPYWTVLVPASIVLGTLRWTATFVAVVCLRIVIFLGYYPWVTIGWLLGLKPRYWRGWTASIESGEESLYITRRQRDHGYWVDKREWRWWLPVFVTAPLTVLGILAYFLFGHGQGEVGWLTSFSWYFTLAIVYGSLLALIALGNGWKHGVSPLMKRVYYSVCPELEIIESAPSPAEPANG